ncbi:hypothetical protein [Streptomyces coelicoflavus]|uniref:hypothetical protein n=1 Tax=Streptomyces coelicoflavus TaxID=285562 RepID=UPI00131EDE69|nr:hypothetical protein [Streptomyces coelicoflavus]
MKMRFSLLVAGGILAVSPLALQSTAIAATDAATGWPTGCSAKKILSDAVGAQCTNSNGGHYKAIANCKSVVGGVEFSREAGVWKSSGLSVVYCPSGSYVTDAGYMEKAS